MKKDIAESVATFLSPASPAAPHGAVAHVRATSGSVSSSSSALAVTDRPPTAAVLTRIALAWMMNTHAFCGDYTVALPRGRLLAHSCIPTLLYTSEQDGGYFFAIRPIAPGEIASFCYFEHWLLLAPTYVPSSRIRAALILTLDCARLCALAYAALQLAPPERTSRAARVHVPLLPLSGYRTSSM